MAWERLNTPDIWSVKYYPAKQILKARLKSGHFEVYKHVTEARYRELLASGHPHDVDTFFSNIIRPNRVSVRISLRSKFYRFTKLILVIALGLAILTLFGLWNSGILAVYLMQFVSGKS